MTNARTRGNVCSDVEMRMSLRIRREVELLAFNKGRYDLDHPDHRKDIPPTELKQIARAKVTHELCVPPCSDQDGVIWTLFP